MRCFVDSIYREQLMELYKNPTTKGPLEGATHQHISHNPLCGDEVKIMLKIQNEKVIEARFEGTGCAISMASSALLTELLEGMTVEQVKKLDREFIMKELGIELGPVRIKCALLCLEATHEALGGQHA
jgi:nitrogen fixation protein NifU and related proteins